MQQDSSAKRNPRNGKSTRRAWGRNVQELRKFCDLRPSGGVRPSASLVVGRLAWTPSWRTLPALSLLVRDSLRITRGALSLVSPRCVRQL